MLKFLSSDLPTETVKEDIMKIIGNMMSNKIKDKGDNMVFGNSSLENVASPQINAGSRMDDLNAVLAELKTGSGGDIDACAVISDDGLTMASALPTHMAEASVSSMCAMMTSMGQRVSVELSRGSLEQIFIKGEAGMVISQHAGEHAVLLVLAPKEAKLGLIFYDIANAANRVKKILA